MGCFNTIIFKCAHCGEEIEEQTKNGSCSLSCDYLDGDTAEVEDVLGVSGYPIECYYCSKKSIIRTQVRAVSVVEKYSKEE
jgi:DNA-directed RNA polymerase subunit RPC12/RpoP